MSESMWWYSKDGQRLGPEPLTVLQDLVNAGELQRDALVWCEGMEDWLEAGKVEALDFLFKEPPPLPAQPIGTSGQDTHNTNTEKHESEHVSVIDRFVDNYKKEKTATPLAADVRRKYIKTLARRYETAGWIISFIITLVVLSMLRVDTWVFIVILLVGTSAGPATLEHLREKKLLKTSDQLLQVLYGEYLKKKHYTKLASTIIGGVFIVMVAAILILSEPARNKARDYFSSMLSDARCEVVTDSAYEDAFIISQKSDYGYTVKAKIKNTGEEGEVSLVVKLYTSEGDFQRKQKIQLSADETRTLFYQFSEPTLNVTNVRYSVRCRPE